MRTRDTLLAGALGVFGAIATTAVVVSVGHLATSLACDDDAYRAAALHHLPTGRPEACGVGPLLQSDCSGLDLARAENWVARARDSADRQTDRCARSALLHWADYFETTALESATRTAVDGRFK